MKGLLLKDFYVLKTEYKYVMLIMLAYTAVMMFTSSVIWILYLAPVLGGMPVYLLGSDERSRWNKFSTGLPYSAAQIVSSKYILGLATTAFVMLVIPISCVIKLLIYGRIDTDQLIIVSSVNLALCLLLPAISLPFIFKLGYEKGFLSLLLTVGVLTGITMTISSKLENSIDMEFLSSIPPALILLIAVLICIGFYAFSWLMSVKLYEKREF